AGDGGDDRVAGGDHVGFDQAVHAGALGGPGGDGAVGVGGAHGDHVLVEAGAADGQAAVLAVVARGEHGDDPGGVPQVDDVGVERVVAAVAGPGVVDHVGGHRRVGVVARGVGGRGYPLPGGQEGLQGRRGARGGGDQFGAGGDADA